MKKINEFIADALRMPKDVVMDLPRISICGDREIYIENHKGLIEYTDEQLRIKMNDGIIRIKGRELKIIVMEYERMVINGIFESVDYKII